MSCLLQNEMKFMSKLNHPNIVKLIGFCHEGEHRMLVYEYMSKGSLETQLLAGKSSDHLLLDDTSKNYAYIRRQGLGAIKSSTLIWHKTAEKEPQLDWSRRIKVAIGLAKALDSLHNRGTPVIHRDLKASNVLLDDVRLSITHTSN
jgi:serine/threonine protein kinase